MPLDPYGLLESYKSKANEEIGNSSRKRRNRMNELTEKAQVSHRTGNYEGSYDLFCELLSLVETDPKNTQASEAHATITANLASAMHFLGELELARDFYEKALDEFAKVEVGWITWLYYGNLTEKRKDYIRARLENLSRGERPDPSTYQDGTGKTRYWSKEEMEGTERNWSFFSPYSWLYGGYKPLGAQVVEVEGRSASSAPETVA